MTFPIQFSFLCTIFLVVMVVFFISRGYKRGLVSEAFAIATFFLSAISSAICVRFFDDHIHFLKITLGRSELMRIETFVNKTVDRLILFVIFFVLSYIVLLIIRHFLKGINKLRFIGGMNQMLGGVLGAIHAILVVVILLLVLASPLFTNGKRVIEAAKLSFVDEMIMELPIVGKTMKTFHLIEEYRANDSFNYEKILERIQNGD
ncbi:MAG: CvpA family protein [Breznakia sp.]